MIAINTSNVDDFKILKLDNKNNNIYIVATFIDGSAAYVLRENENKFNLQGGLEPYIELLKRFKDYNSTNNNYKIIECYDSDNNTFVIPSLINNKKQLVK